MATNFIYLLPRNVRRASSWYCMVRNDLDNWNFISFCSVIYTRISGEFCFNVVYIWQFVVRINGLCCAIMGFLYRGTPNSSTYTNMLPLLLTRSGMNGERSSVSLCPQGNILYRTPYPKARYFIGILSSSFFLETIFGVSSGQFHLFLSSSLTLIRQSFEIRNSWITYSLFCVSPTGESFH